MAMPRRLVEPVLILQAICSPTCPSHLISRPPVPSTPRIISVHKAISTKRLPLRHPNLFLNLFMNARHTSHLITPKNILPRDTRITSSQNFLVQARTSVSQTRRSPFSLACNLQFHAPSNRLRNSKSPTQSLHLESILRLLPFLKAVLERVGTVGQRGWGGGCYGNHSGSYAGAERVVESWGGGCAEGCGLEV